MSKKIYARLLRLYPASFRKEYEGEALQLIRDRFRNEKGFAKRARLWWDLLVDVLVGLPSAYRNSYAVPEAASVSLKAAGIPSFKIMDEEALGLFSILIGGTISLIVLAVFAFLLSRPIARDAIPSTHGRISPIESVLQRLNRAADGSDWGSFQGATTLGSAQMSERKGQSLTGSVSGQNMPSSLSETGIPPMAVNSIPRFGVAAMKPSISDRPAKMSFEVASIRQSKPGTFKPPIFALDNSDAYTPADPGGRFIADFPLQVYISFAYKLWLTPEQTDSMLAHLPKWAATDSFEIHAKAEGSPSKDQMRLMMQSLLADRFKLAVHFETQQTAVFALALDKPGRPGSKLRPHSDGPACDVHLPTTPGGPGNVDGVFPPVCDAFMLNSTPNHDMLLGSRNATMQLIADSLPSLGRLGRPVVDQTGLKGRFDFTLQWTPDSEPGANIPLESQGTTFVEALKDQLGMKLKPTKAPMDVLVVDHVERPSEN